MRVTLAALLWAAPLFVASAVPAWAESALVAELRVWTTRYHENPQKIAELRAALEEAAQADADLDRSEAMFRRGLELDPRYTNMRVGLARTLWKKGRTADAKREALGVLDEKAPSNPADWTVKDVPQAKALLEQIKGRS